MQPKNSIPITKEMLNQLYEKRVLLFVEQMDGSFSQVVFDRSQFKRMMLGVMGLFPHEVNETTHTAQVELSLGKVIDGKTFDGFENVG